jgi:DNA-binding IclR family transcriptional regulator
MREDHAACERKRLVAVLQAVRVKGFAIRDREINPKATGIAVPIRVADRILGCLSSISISSAMTIAEAETKLLPPQQSAAQKLKQP